MIRLMEVIFVVLLRLIQIISAAMVIMELLFWARERKEKETKK